MFKKQSGVIPLENGYGLIVPRESNNKDLMVTIGMLVQMWAYAEIESGGLDKNKFKEMMIMYVDTILEKMEGKDEKNS